MIASEANRAMIAPLVPQVAAVAIVASVLGRALAPALRGAGEGIDAFITYTSLAANFATYLFAFMGLFVLVLELSATFREKTLGLVYRSAAAVSSACIVALVVYAFRGPLSERASVIAALMSSGLALFASREALSVPRTRALGVTLAAVGVAALFHLSASALAYCAGGNGLARFPFIERLFSAGTVIFDTAALLTAFAWLTTRRNSETAWIARAALFIGCIVAWGALRGVRDGASLWQIVANRAVDRMLPGAPAVLVWRPLRVLLETSAPCLGIAALVARNQMPAMTGALALALIARPSTDVPLAAMALVLAALSAPLAARDDRGMWAALMAESRS